jgi:hypothetical protein
LRWALKRETGRASSATGYTLRSKRRRRCKPLLLLLRSKGERRSLYYRDVALGYSRALELYT